MVVPPNAAIGSKRRLKRLFYLAMEVNVEKMLKCLASVLAVCFFAPGTLFAQSVHVAFINPGSEDAADVWSQIPRFMSAAAQQFGFRLEVLHANRDRLRMVELAQQLANRPIPPNYVVVVNEKQRAPEMMALFKGARTRLMLIHNDLTPEQRQQVGNEREQLANWIGTLTMDLDTTPHAMMTALYRKSRVVPKIVGITGDSSTPVSALGEQSVRAFVAQAGRGEMLQVVAGNWERADAADKARSLLRRYPEANMIWAFNDVMALGALDAVTAMDRRDTVLVGGMGTFPAGLQSVAAGGLAVTAGGGVLLTGALSMVMIYDYEMGRDFWKAGGAHQNNRIVITVEDAASVTRFQNLMAQPGNIDFRRLSLTQNPNQRAYQFTYESILAAFAK